jgi:hypothetical protein
MREEMVQLMNKRRPKPKLSRERAQELGRHGAQKRWAKANKN